MAIRRLSLTELAMVAIILDEEEENRGTQRRYWIHESLRKRKTEGEYWTLYRHLVDDEEKFFSYFRMTSFQFNELLRKIENDITKRNTPFRDSLSPKEKLYLGCCKLYRNSYLRTHSISSSSFILMQN